MKSAAARKEDDRTLSEILDHYAYLHGSEAEVRREGEALCAAVERYLGLEEKLICWEQHQRELTALRVV